MNTSQAASSAPNPASGAGASLSPPPETSRRSLPRWAVVLLGLVIFVCGGVVGAGLTLRFLRYRVLYAIHHPIEIPARLTRELKSRLGLSDAQAERVRQIILKRQLDLQKIRREVQPRVEADLQDLRKEIEGTLTPVQAAKWNAWFNEMRRTWLPPPPPASAGQF